MEKEFVTIKEYLKQTGHTPQNVYRWIREGKINKDDLSLKVVEIQMINKNLVLKKKWSHPQNQPLKEQTNESTNSI